MKTDTCRCKKTGLASDAYVMRAKAGIRGISRERCSIAMPKPTRAGARLRSAGCSAIGGTT
ncbi:hypothetical protein [Rhizobacter sp. LjRoot28]|uniref:hypothetical protein n=1 Tax=Rhizobacter sp. LjRoot28 TaxID=3342309 RepID=UPI003ECF6511